jgi:hypothetical protein
MSAKVKMIGLQVLEKPRDHFFVENEIAPAHFYPLEFTPDIQSPFVFPSL